MLVISVAIFLGCARVCFLNIRYRHLARATSSLPGACALSLQTMAYSSHWGAKQTEHLDGGALPQVPVARSLPRAAPMKLRIAIDRAWRRRAGSGDRRA